MSNNTKSNFFDSLFSSCRDAFSFKNFMKRLLFFFFFGILLGLRQLIRNVDAVGYAGGGVFGFIRAFTLSTWQGIGVALSSLWSFFVDYRLYFSSSAWGSLIVGVIMCLALIGFFFQPISLFVNLFDGHSSRDTGNSSGNATGWIVRLAITLVIIIMLSASSFYGEWSEPILSDVDSLDDDVDGVVGVPGNESVNGSVEEVVEDSLINSINLL